MLEQQEKIREQFPFLKKFVYFDAAHYTPYPLRVVEKMNEFINEFTGDFINLSIYNRDKSAELKETCAKLINANSDKASAG